MKILLLSSLISCSSGFSTRLTVKQSRQYTSFVVSAENRDNQEVAQQDDVVSSSSLSRRGILSSLGVGLIGGVSAVNPASAVERAVGAAEKKCQEVGNCLESGDLDAAVGWQWGAKDRCDPTDPKCGVDGAIADLEGAPVPETASNKITHRVRLQVKIGRQEEGTINLGLYGESSPQSVSQLVRFLSPEGLRTSSWSTAYTSQPVAFAKHGLGGVTEIVPNQEISLGILSQAAAYARANGLTSAGPEFVAQPRPFSVEKEKSVRPHDRAGLVSIASKGVGYANSNCGNDAAFANAFSITASSVPALDKTNKVVGQVMDPESMAFLARLSRLPTKKGFKGVVPGLNSGPPLLKTTVASVAVEKVQEEEKAPVAEEEPKVAEESSNNDAPSMAS